LKPQFCAPVRSKSIQAVIAWR